MRYTNISGLIESMSAGYYIPITMAGEKITKSSHLLLFHLVVMTTWPGLLRDGKSNEATNDLAPERGRREPHVIFVRNAVIAL
jgi:hypothetical protein